VKFPANANMAGNLAGNSTFFVGAGQGNAAVIAAERRLPQARGLAGRVSGAWIASGSEVTVRVCVEGMMHIKTKRATN
jgi:hypothetical protein